MVVVVVVDALPSGIAQVGRFRMVLLSLPASHVHNIFGVVLLRLPASHGSNILEMCTVVLERSQAMAAHNHPQVKRCCFAFQRRMGRTFWRCAVPPSGIACVKDLWLVLLRLPALRPLNIFQRNEG